MDRATAEKMLETFKGIYGTMYGCTYIKNSGGYYVKDNIIFIEKEKLDINDSCISFVWGWPGPDMNLYKWEDYNKTWGFYECDIGDPALPDGCVKCDRCIYSPMTYGSHLSIPKECPRSKEIFQGRMMVDKFEGCCDKDKASDSRFVYPVYKPRPEDLYNIKYVPLKEDGDIYE